MSNTNSNYANYLNSQNTSTNFINSNSGGFSTQNSGINYASNSNSYFHSFSNNTQVQARSLWIGEIDPWMDEGFMIKIFQEVANVKNIKIIRDKTKGTSLGYGFIEFENPELAKEVLQSLNGKLIPECNRTLKLNWASYSAGKQALINSNQGIIDYSIYVGDLDPSVTEDSLKDFFCKYYASVIGVKLIIDPIIKNSKGYGFVKFADQNEANKALNEMNGKVMHGKAIRTNQASFKKITGELGVSTSTSSSQLNYSGNPNTQSPYTNYPSNYSIEPSQNLVNNSYTNSSNYTNNNFDYSPINTGLRNVAKSNKATYNSSTNPDINGNYFSTHGYEVNTNTNKPNLNLNHLNNFYMSNPNIDYNTDVYTADSNYNLNNFYHNNYNLANTKVNSQEYISNKRGSNSLANNNGYFNYANNADNISSGQNIPSMQNSSSYFMYNYGNQPNMTNWNLNFNNLNNSTTNPNSNPQQDT